MGFGRQKAHPRISSIGSIQLSFKSSPIRPHVRGSPNSDWIFSPATSRRLRRFQGGNIARSRNGDQSSKQLVSRRSEIASSPAVGQSEPPSFAAGAAGLASIAVASEANCGSAQPPAFGPHRPADRCSPETGRRGGWPSLRPRAITHHRAHFGRPSYGISFVSELTKSGGRS